MNNPQPRDERTYAIAFANGALQHCYFDDPAGIGLIEPATDLTTSDLLAAAVEMLLEQVNPGGPKPWLNRPATSRCRPGPADQATSVTMTDIWGDEGLRPTWPR